MKKQLLSIFLVAGIFSASITSAQTWTPIFASGMPLTGGGTIISNSVSDVSFFDDNNGIVSMWSQNHLFRTTDGGSTWAAGTYTFGNVGNFDAVHIKDAQTILIGTNNGRVYKSADGGTTFSLIGTPVSDVNAMAFSGNNGVLVDNSCQGARTSNMGDAWTTISNTVLCGNLTQMNHVNFSSPNTVYIAGNSSKFFKSLNAGTTWSAVTVPSGNIKGLWFTDDNTGYITTSNVVRKTTDGGSTWTNIAISPTLGTLGVNSGRLYANGNVLYVGIDNKILRSTDGGATFVIDFDLTPVNATGVVKFTAAGNSLFVTVNTSGTNPQVYKRSNTISSLKEDPHSKGFLIYPNPANEIIHIELKDKNIDTQCTLYDITGKKCHEAPLENGIVSLKGLEAGVYFLEVKNSNVMYTTKIIKN